MRRVDRRSSSSRWAARTAGCRRSASGSDGARRDLRRRRLHLAAQLLRGARRRPGQLPGRAASTSTGSSRRRSRPATTCGPRGRHQKLINLSVDEWNVWYQSRFARIEENLEWAHAPRLIEDTYSVRRRGRGRRSDDLAAAARRPGQDRLPGAAGQRDRPDPVGARRPGVAAGQLPPVRADLGHGGARCCGPTVRGPTHETKWLGEVPVLEWWPSTTRRPARSRCSRSTARRPSP